MAAAIVMGELISMVISYQTWQEVYDAKVAHAAQQELTAYLFHEMRNDLNALVGFFDELDEAVAMDSVTLTPSISASLLSAHAHSRHGAQVIQNVLDFSKLRAGKLALPSLPFSISGVVSQSVALSKCLLRGKPVQLLVSYEEDWWTSLAPSPPTEPLVIGSSYHLLAVLLNLLSNACKYTDAGSVTLSVTVASSAASTASSSENSGGGAAALKFRVTDTGCGILPEKRDAIFDLYEQGELHFPPRLRVLVADDSRVNRTLLKKRLLKILPEDAQLEEAETGEAALELLVGSAGGEDHHHHHEGAPFHMAFLDEHYDVANGSLLGTDVARRVREVESAQSPRRGRAVLVGVSGMESEEHRAKSLDAGQDAVWGKPLPEIAEMHRVLASLLLARGKTG